MAESLHVSNTSPRPLESGWYITTGCSVYYVTGECDDLLRSIKSECLSPYDSLITLSSPSKYLLRLPSSPLLLLLLLLLLLSPIMSITVALPETRRQHFA
jgi:hypothetical protein